jgi:pimeloyl-ACP methyl ester carboxylesterase
MYLSVQCGEEVPFNIASNVRQAPGAAYQRLNIAAREEIESVRAGCSVWNVARGAPRENEPVVSDIPTLVLAGEFDPITPPSYGRDTARTLNRSHFYLFRGFSHGVLDEGCPMDIVADFLARPTLEPDVSCVDRLPPFEFESP